MPPIFEELAQKIHGYVKLIEEMSKELRKNPLQYQAAYDRVASSSFTAQPGQAWIPPREERQAYIEHLDSVCRTIPTCDDDRVKILFAGYAALAYFPMYVIAEEPQRTQTKIKKRVAELQKAYIQELVSRGEVDTRSFTLRPEPALDPYTPPDSLNRCQLTDEEREAISTNPMIMVGKQFIHHPDSSEGLVYKVVGVHVAEGGITYEVQFRGCVDFVQVGNDEMEVMFQNSVLVG